MPNATIIIVDDEEELRENLFDLLDFKGYHVVAFSTGEEVLEKYESLQPDLLLLDIQLPGIDGIEVLSRIRKKYTRDALPIAMVSASSIPVVLTQAERAGANRTILKPYALQEMLTAVAELLGDKAITAG
jgi:CheY-like chemotaxis protein